IGAAGATYVRFLFGFSFLLIFLAGIWLYFERFPLPGLQFLPFVTVSALAPILATALMLLAINEKSFVVAITSTKTEPILVALFGLAVLGDVLTMPSLVAILLATAGVVAISFQKRDGQFDLKPMMLGIGSGATFALSAVSLRGAVLTLNE